MTDSNERKGPRGFPSWDAYYQANEVEDMPWFHTGLDHDIDRALGEHRIVSGTILDIGTGPGTQAVELARRGLKVTATDVSAAAIEKARQRALAEGVEVDLFEDDVLDTRLDTQFDTIVDRGCFHVFAAEARPTFVGNVHGLLKPHGLLFLKTFSHLESGEEGPHRFHPDQIRDLFEPRFDVLRIDESFYQGTRTPQPRALFCVLRAR